MQADGHAVYATATVRSGHSCIGNQESYSYLHVVVVLAWPAGLDCSCLHTFVTARFWAGCCEHVCAIQVKSAVAAAFGRGGVLC